MVTMLPTAALATSFPTLSPPPSAPVALPTSDIAVLLRSVPTVSAYRTFSYNGYSFEIPRTWSSRIEDGLAKEVIFETNGEEVARLTCPPPTVGYELWDFTASRRSLVRNHFMYDVELNLGKPSAEAIYDKDSIAFLVVTHRGYQTRGEGAYWDPGYGCQLTSHSEDYASLSALYRRIYRSVKVEDWKLGIGAGLRFRYPAAWSMKSADIDSDWKRQIFADVNGREVAALDCPIPGQGFHDYEMSVSERKLKKQNGDYGIKWMWGSVNDEEHGKIYVMQHIGWSKAEPKIGNVDYRQYSCRLVSQQDGQKGIFREIYKSLK